MSLNTITILFFLIFACIIIRKTYSAENDEPMDDTIVESPLILSNSALNVHYPIINKETYFETPSFSSHRRSESAEKYFGWAGKTQRPVEYLRGKRFWLFAKKDESDRSAESMPPINTHQSSLAQGLWRSGIVGRRRR